MLRWEIEGGHPGAGVSGVSVDSGRAWAALAASYGPVVAVAGAAVGVIAGIAARTASAFQSDDVAQIVAVRSWVESGTTTYYAGSNTYGLRFPLVALVDLLTSTGKDQLLLLTSVLMAMAAVLLAVAARWQARVGYGAVSGALAVAWVLSNPGVADAIARPTVRNVELGAAALALVGLDRLGAWPTRWATVTLPAAAVGLALFLWNDPYFSLVVAVPALGLALLGAALARSLWRLAVAGTIAVGIAGSRVLDAIGFLGVDALQVPFTYPEPEEQQLAKDLLFRQLPHAMGTGVHRTGLTDQQALWNRWVVGLLIVCASLTLVWCVRRWRDLPVGSLTAATMVIVPSLAWYASGNMLTDERSWRYIMMTPFVLPILLVPAASALPRAIRPAFLTFAGGVIAVSAWTNLVEARDDARCGLDESCVPQITLDQERQDNAYAAWLQNAGVEKVLVPYWHSNTTTYLSDGKVPAVTIDCRDNRVVTWRWLTTEARVDAPVARSHLVLEGGHAAGCYAQDILKQLGPPVEIRRFSDYQLWEYQGDLVERLPTRKG